MRTLSVVSSVTQYRVPWGTEFKHAHTCSCQGRSYLLALEPGYWDGHLKGLTGSKL